jgi:zinc transport system substrate-binding protein
MFLFLATLACTPEVIDENTSGVNKPIVRSLSFPVHYLVQQLGGEKIISDCILPVGEDPTSWYPSTEIISSLQQADLIVSNGAGYEGWTKTASLPSSKVLYSAASLNLIEGKVGTHSHGKGGEHSHGELDPKTWSDPNLFAQQAEVIHKALVNISPEEADYFTKNLTELKQQLQQLSTQYETSLKPLVGVKMSASQPSYSYLAHAYNLEIENFDFDPEKSIESVNLAKFSTWSLGMTKPILLWETEPVKDVKEAFPEYAIQTYIDPLEQPESNNTYDYIAQAKQNIARFDELIKKLQEDK